MVTLCFASQFYPISLGPRGAGRLSRILEALFESSRLESQQVVVCFMEKRKSCGWESEGLIRLKK